MCAKVSVESHRFVSQSVYRYDIRFTFPLASIRLISGDVAEMQRLLASNRHSKHFDFALEEMNLPPDFITGTSLNSSTTSSLNHFDGVIHSTISSSSASCFSSSSPSSLLDVVDASGNAPLHRACANSHLDAVKFLLQKGANVNQVYSSIRFIRM